MLYRIIVMYVTFTDRHTTGTPKFALEMAYRRIEEESIYN